MKRLIVDMDGVLSDIYAQFLNFEEQDLGIIQKNEDLIGKLENEAFLNHDNYINSENFFLTAKPIEGSIETMKLLNSKYDLYIVSSATQFPLSLTEKMKWIKIYFPFITWKQVVLCGTKEIVVGDIMIDDHFKNLDNFKGETILFSQPHNANRSSKNHKRVENWKEIEILLI